MSIVLGEHFVQLRGVRFWYKVTGSGPPLIIQAPGWGLGSEYLRNGLSPLEAHYTLVFYDTRGSGRSSRPADEGSMSISDMIDDLESLRDYWELPEMHLLGHSHGGDISLGYAIRYAGRVTKLILVDSGINDFDAEAVIAEQLKVRIGDPRFMSAIGALASTIPPKTDLEFSKRLKTRLPLFFYDPDRFMERFEKDMTAWPSAWANRNFDAAEAQSTLAQDSVIDHVRASTLILVGRNDWVCPPIISERIHRAIVNSQLKIFERTGHFPWIEVPHEFFASISEFLSASQYSKPEQEPG